MKLSSVRELKAELLERETGAFVGLGADWPRSARAQLFAIGYEKAPTRAAVAFGVAPTRRKGDYELAVRLFDKSHTSQAVALRALERSKREANVLFVGRIRAPRKAKGPAAFDEKTDPLRPGFSVGHYKVTAGTIGAFAKRGNAIHILSNNHVLANTNLGRQGDRVLQPGKIDGGKNPRDMVARLSHFEQLAMNSNDIDAALAELEPDTSYEVLYGSKKLRGVADESDLQQSVWKVGRTTGLTRGLITAFDLDRVDIDYSEDGDGSLVYTFEKQLEIEGKGGDFSSGGDSGALILNNDDKAVGLLFAGSDVENRTYANRIEVVLKEMRCSLIES